MSPQVSNRPLGGLAYRCDYLMHAVSQPECVSKVHDACCPEGQRDVWRCSTHRHCLGSDRVRGCCWCIQPLHWPRCRCASPGYLVWCRGLPLLQTVSQSLGADVSRLSVSVSPPEALLPHVKMHEHSQVRASASNCMQHHCRHLCHCWGCQRGGQGLAPRKEAFLRSVWQWMAGVCCHHVLIWWSGYLREDLGFWLCFNRYFSLLKNLALLHMLAFAHRCLRHLSAQLVVYSGSPSWEPPSLSFTLYSLLAYLSASSEQETDCQFR